MGTINSVHYHSPPPLPPPPPLLSISYLEASLFLLELVSEVGDFSFFHQERVPCDALRKYHSGMINGVNTK